VTRWKKYSFSALAMTVSLSGGAYGWMKYLLTTDDPFAVVNHPLQPLMLHLHVASAPAFLVLFGILLDSHVAERIGRDLPNRGSGLLSFGTILVMSVSGYALQIVTGDRARQVWVAAHLGSGLLFAVAYSVHLFVSVWMWLTSPPPQRTSIT